MTISGAPALISPPDAATLVCATTGSYVFIWGAVPNATSYILEVWTTSTPSLPVEQQIVTATTASVAYTVLPCGAIYRWRVGATFASAPTAWSGYWTFTILP